MFLLTVPALAHDWYPWECCSGRDCKMLPAGAVREVPGGYFIVETREFVAYRDSRPSPDGEYHRCAKSFAHDGASPDTLINHRDGKPCLWVPQPSY